LEYVPGSQGTHADAPVKRKSIYFIKLERTELRLTEVTVIIQASVVMSMQK
jgi:hypothetical protein